MCTKVPFFVHTRERTDLFGTMAVSEEVPRTRAVHPCVRLCVCDCVCVCVHACVYRLCSCSVCERVVTPDGSIVRRCHGRVLCSNQARSNFCVIKGEY